MLPKPTPRKRERRPLRRSRAPIARKSGRRGKRTPAHLKTLRARERLADKLWSFLVLQRPDVCEFCVEAVSLLNFGERSRIFDPHHLNSRRFKATRWMVHNGAKLCRSCHEMVTRHPAQNRRLAEMLLGKAAWFDLRAYASAPFRIEQPSEAIERLRSEVRARGLESIASALGLMEAK